MKWRTFARVENGEVYLDRYGGDKGCENLLLEYSTKWSEGQWKEKCEEVAKLDDWFVVEVDL